MPAAAWSCLSNPACLPVWHDLAPSPARLPRPSPSLPPQILLNDTRCFTTDLEGVLEDALRLPAAGSPPDPAYIAAFDLVHRHLAALLKSLPDPCTVSAPVDCWAVLAVKWGHAGRWLLRGWLPAGCQPAAPALPAAQQIATTTLPQHAPTLPPCVVQGPAAAKCLGRLLNLIVQSAPTLLAPPAGLCKTNLPELNTNMERLREALVRQTLACAAAAVAPQPPPLPLLCQLMLLPSLWLPSLDCRCPWCKFCVAPFISGATHLAPALCSATAGHLCGRRRQVARGRQCAEADSAVRRGALSGRVGQGFAA